jgi:hypothetical protein
VVRHGKERLGRCGEFTDAEKTKKGECASTPVKVLAVHRDSHFPNAPFDESHDINGDGEATIWWSGMKAIVASKCFPQEIPTERDFAALFLNVVRESCHVDFDSRESRTVRKQMSNKQEHSSFVNLERWPIGDMAKFNELSNAGRVRTARGG